MSLSSLTISCFCALFPVSFYIYSRFELKFVFIILFYSTSFFPCSSSLHYIPRSALFFRFLFRALLLLPVSASVFSLLFFGSIMFSPEFSYRPGGLGVLAESDQNNQSSTQTTTTTPGGSNSGVLSPPSGGPPNRPLPPTPDDDDAQGDRTLIKRVS